jgi:hypothetical protein
MLLLLHAISPNAHLPRDKVAQQLMELNSGHPIKSTTGGLSEAEFKASVCVVGCDGGKATVDAT